VRGHHAIHHKGVAPALASHLERVHQQRFGARDIDEEIAADAAIPLEQQLGDPAMILEPDVEMPVQ
jgi:hypothetical protein